MEKLCPFCSVLVLVREGDLRDAPPERRADAYMLSAFALALRAQDQEDDFTKRLCDLHLDALDTFLEHEALGFSEAKVGPS